MNLADIKLAVIGLGYVGLPLAAEFGKKRPVVGFDINQKRITDLQSGIDHTLEVSGEELKEASQLSFTNRLADLSGSNCLLLRFRLQLTNTKIQI